LEAGVAVVYRPSTSFFFSLFWGLVDGLGSS